MTREHDSERDEEHPAEPLPTLPTAISGQESRGVERPGRTRRHRAGPQDGSAPPEPARQRAIPPSGDTVQEPEPKVGYEAAETTELPPEWAPAPPLRSFGRASQGGFEVAPGAGNRPPRGAGRIADQPADYLEHRMLNGRHRSTWRAFPQRDSTDPRQDASSAAHAPAPPAAAGAASTTAAPPSSLDVAEPARGGQPGAGSPERLPGANRRPIRDRFGRKVVGLVVLVVLAVLCTGLVAAVVAKTRNDETLAAQSAASYTPPPIATPRPAGAGPYIAVIGDDTTSTAAPGVRSTQRWTRLLGSAISGTVGVDASAGAGYAVQGAGGRTFRTAADLVPSNARVVVFFGGAADASVSAESLQIAATQAFRSASRRAPRAELIVVGPAIAPETSVKELSTIRTTLRSAARDAEARWVDPIGADWLTSKQQRGTAEELSAADEKIVATRITTAVKAALN